MDPKPADGHPLVLRGTCRVPVRRERRVIRFGRVQTETVLRVSQPTRARSAQADLVLLHAMLNWATTVRGPHTTNDTRWLSTNPLKGIERRPEKNPRRRVTCQERFDATSRAIHALGAHAPEDPDERLTWIRLELALVLAEATGWRIGAIRQLRWEDIDYATPAIGGWKSLRSLLECYAQADRDTMRAVVNEPRKLMSTDLQPSQLATREPWSTPAGRSHKRCSRRAKQCRCEPRRTRPSTAFREGARHGSESSTRCGESSTATS